MENAQDGAMQKRMMQGCIELSQLATRLGNINTAITNDLSDVPTVIPVLYEGKATISAVHDGKGAYDIWTTSSQPKPVKFGLSINNAARLLIDDYVLHKRRMMERRPGSSRRKLDQYFAEMHNGFGRKGI